MHILHNASWRATTESLQGASGEIVSITVSTVETLRSAQPCLNWNAAQTCLAFGLDLKKQTLMHFDIKPSSGIYLLFEVNQHATLNCSISALSAVWTFLSKQASLFFKFGLILPKINCLLEIYSFGNLITD